MHRQDFMKHMFSTGLGKFQEVADSQMLFFCFCFCKILNELKKKMIQVSHMHLKNSLPLFLPLSLSSSLSETRSHYFTVQPRLTQNPRFFCLSLLNIDVIDVRQGTRPCLSICFYALSLILFVCVIWLQLQVFLCGAHVCEYMYICLHWRSSASVSCLFQFIFTL